jgi:hypothetical protein
MTFDPDQHKTTTRRQWEDYAGGWNAWAPLLESWLGDATDLSPTILEHAAHAAAAATR